MKVKVFRESNNWVEHKEGFMITLEAQKLTHLVDKSYLVADPDLDKAQLKHLYKVMKDSLVPHQAKSIVKMHTKTKDTRAIWEQACKTYNESTRLRRSLQIRWEPNKQKERENKNTLWSSFEIHLRDVDTKR